MKLQTAAREAYKKAIAAIEKDFWEKCDLDTKLHDSDMDFTATSARIDLITALKTAHTKMIDIRLALSNKICLKEAVVDTMVSEFNSLEGMANPLTFMDSLLDEHPSVLQWLSLALEGDVTPTPASPTNLHDTDIAGTLSEQLWYLVQEYQDKYCKEATLQQKALQYKGLINRLVMNEEKNELELIVGMTLSEKWVALVFRRAYPDYSFVDSSQYSQPEYILFCSLFVASTLSKTLKEVPTFLTCVNLSKDDFKQIIHDELHSTLECNSAAVSALVTKPKEPVMYILLCKSTEISHTAELTDVHSARHCPRFVSALAKTQPRLTSVLGGAVPLSMISSWLVMPDMNTAAFC